MLTHENRHFFSGRWCVYCGHIADTREHFPPISVSVFGLVLPCCAFCNASIREQSPDDFDGRVSIARRALRRSFAKDVAVPDWHISELMTISARLRKGVSRSRTRKRVITERLHWDWSSYLQSLCRSPAQRELLRRWIPSAFRRESVSRPPRR